MPLLTPSTGRSPSCRKPSKSCITERPSGINNFKLVTRCIRPRKRNNAPRPHIRGLTQICPRCQLTTFTKPHDGDNNEVSYQTLGHFSVAGCGWHDCQLAERSHRFETAACCFQSPNRSNRGGEC